METDESMPGSSASSSESSDNSGNSQPSTPIFNRVSSPSNIDKEPEIQLKDFSQSSPVNNERIHSGSRKTRSSTSQSSSENEDNQAIERIISFDRQSSESVSSAASIAENIEDEISQNPSSPLSKFREYSISPTKSHCSSNASPQSNDDKFIQEIEFSSRDYEKKETYDDKEDGTINISHEDLSDVSDIENEKRIESTNNVQDFHNDNEALNNSSNDRNKENNRTENEMIDLRQKLDAKKNQVRSFDICSDFNENSTKTNGKNTDNIDDLVKKHDEDALDFEAEEGECPELGKDDLDNSQNETTIPIEKGKDGNEELEEGEVSDENEKRPEETEPKPVCRFYTRGACTWGMSCRFLHPGVTDKGNYTMFDMIRPVPIASNSAHTSSFTPSYPEYRERSTLLHRPPPIHHANYSNNAHSEQRLLGSTAAVANSNIDQVPPIESAWERGLRTAKEMMRKASKRKEQDMDFEDKKMNLTLSPDELEKDNYYIRDRASPEPNPPYAPRGHPPIYGHDAGLYSPPAHRLPLRVSGAPTYDDIDPYGRSSRYRELPPHRMPQYEDERRVRPTREVIVQRIEPSGRGDEWSDPWMRSKSPSGREREKRTILRRERSYSSNSSYSSSSTSRSGSSSDTSRSISADTRRRRYNSTHSSHKSPLSRRHIKPTVKSPSPARRRRSTSYRRSPIPKKRHVSPSSISPRRAMASPGNKRKRLSPVQRRFGGEKNRNKKRGVTSSSGSGSSDTTGSESETSYSSSSSSSSRGKTPIKRTSGRLSEKVIVADRKFSKKGEISKKRSPISIELKKTSSLGASALSAAIERDNNSNSNSSTTAITVKKTTRREELLKQLRAVEDAIARKKSKLS